MGLIAVAAVLRFAGSGQLPLSGDEAYHWEWSRHLAGAYYDHPGMTAWLIALFGRLGGGMDEALVRLPALCCLLATTVVAFGLARDLALGRGADAAAGRRAGVLAALLVFFVPLPAALSVYMSTDPPLLPFWLGAMWSFHRAVTRGSVAAWVAAGVCLGLAIDTKLIAIQLLGVLSLFLFVTRAGRTWLRRPHPWLTLATLVAVAAPMLLWNAGNDWLTFRFNFAIRQRDQDASIWHPFVFVGGQAAVLTPGFMVLALAACTRRWRRLPPGEAAVVASALLPLAFFGLVSLRRVVGVHWTAAPWLCAFVVLAADLGTRMPWTAARWVRRCWWSSWGITAVVLTAAHAFALAPARFADLDVAGGQPHRILRNLFGWEQVGAATAAAIAALQRDQDARGSQPGVFAMSNQYGTAAAIAYYTPGQPQVHLWSSPRAHGRNYFLWDDWASLRGQDAVYVSKRAFDSWELPYLRERFAEVGTVEEVPVERDGVVRNRFFLVRCRGFDGRQPFPPP